MAAFQSSIDLSRRAAHEHADLTAVDARAPSAAQPASADGGQRARSWTLLPLSMAAAIWASAFCAPTALALWHAAQLDRTSASRAPLVHALGCSFAALFAISAVAARRYARERALLARQLETLSLYDARCGNDADRALILALVALWHGDGEPDGSPVADVGARLYAADGRDGICPPNTATPADTGSTQPGARAAYTRALERAAPSRDTRNERDGSGCDARGWLARVPAPTYASLASRAAAQAGNRLADSCEASSTRWSSRSGASPHGSATPSLPAAACGSATPSLPAAACGFGGFGGFGGASNQPATCLPSPLAACASKPDVAPRTSTAAAAVECPLRAPDAGSCERNLIPSPSIPAPSPSRAHGFLPPPICRAISAASDRSTDRSTDRCGAEVRAVARFDALLRSASRARTVEQLGASAAELPYRQCAFAAAAVALVALDIVASRATALLAVPPAVAAAVAAATVDSGSLGVRADWSTVRACAVECAVVAFAGAPVALRLLFTAAAFRADLTPAVTCERATRDSTRVRAAGARSAALAAAAGALGALAIVRVAEAESGAPTGAVLSLICGWRCILTPPARAAMSALLGGCALALAFGADALCVWRAVALRARTCVATVRRGARARGGRARALPPVLVTVASSPPLLPTDAAVTSGARLSTGALPVGAFALGRGGQQGEALPAFSLGAGDGCRWRARDETDAWLRQHVGGAATSPPAKPRAKAIWRRTRPPLPPPLLLPKRELHSLAHPAWPALTLGATQLPSLARAVLTPAPPTWPAVTLAAPPCALAATSHVPAVPSPVLPAVPSPVLPAVPSPALTPPLTSALCQRPRSTPVVVEGRRRHRSSGRLEREPARRCAASPGNRGLLRAQPEWPALRGARVAPTRDVAAIAVAAVWPVACCARGAPAREAGAASGDRAPHSSFNLKLTGLRLRRHATLC